MLLQLRYVWLIGVLLWLVPGWAQVTGGVFNEEIDARRYDVQLTLDPATTIGQAAAVHVTVEQQGEQAGTRLEITPHELVLHPVDPHGVVRLPNPGIVPGTSYRLTLLRRGDWLGLLHDNHVLYRGSLPQPRGAFHVRVSADAGWTLGDVRVQPLEPLAFADNFMRADDNPGAWTVESGNWGLQSAWDDDPHGNQKRFNYTTYAQHPFAWQGRGGETPALCTTGKPFWEDYMLTTAVLPPAGGAIGVMVHMSTARDGLLLRWSPVNDRGAHGNELALYAVEQGVRTLLAHDAGGYLPARWYRLTVDCTLEAVRVVVDGQERLSVQKPPAWRGGVGLYMEGKARAIFDNVTVYGHSLNTDLIEESQQRRLSARMLEDPQMQNWTRDWIIPPADPSLRVNRREFHGDQRMVLTLTPVAGENGVLTMALCGDGAHLAGGYSATIRRTAEGKTAYTLYDDSTELATATGDKLANDEDYVLRFRREGHRLRLEQDGVTMVEATDPHTPTGLLAAYHAEGAFHAVRDRLVLGRNVRDYLFTEAPVDWIGDGTWMQTVRWACDPKWSFLSGWSHGDVVLWHKQRFHGDQSLEAYLGIKMEYPREREVYEQRYRNLGITICGDGSNPRSGYTGIFGAPENSIPNRRTVLLRNGVEVASAQSALPTRDAGHREWFQLMLVKRGDHLEFWVENNLLLSYTDPQPLADGVPAIWSTDNGISVARVRLDFAGTPQPRTDPQVGIDPIDYPEWLNVGRSLALSFPNACSTTGKPVVVQARTPANIPAENALVIKGAQLTFTPPKPGRYWYQLNAVDGDYRSPGVHLLMPVFDPTLGRDDNHTLLLYRFTEGSGTVVHDLSPSLPSLNLTIPPADLQNGHVHWLPEQGLLLREPATLMSAATANKLQAIAQTRACTLECWISATTRFPPWGAWPQVWEGNIVSWGSSSGALNFALGHHTETCVVATGPGMAPTPGDRRTCTFPGFHSGLLHVVVTWDGLLTTAYLNGVKRTVRNQPWNAAQWRPSNLLLGSLLGQERPFLGAYYLLAIHDRALTLEQVQRHYRAGPSAR